MKFKASIYIKIIAVFLVSIFFSVCFSSVLSYYSLRKNHTSSIYNESEQVFSRLKDFSVSTAWEMNINEFTKLLDREMLNSDIVYMRLYAGNIRYSKIKNTNGILEYGEREDYLDYINSLKLFEFDTQIYSDIYPAGRLTAVFSAEKVKKSINELLIKSTVDSLLFSTFLLILLIIGMKALIINPIVRLNKAVRKFANRDFSVRSPVKSHDEIGYLSRTFNYMAESLEEYTQRLVKQIYYDSLTGLPNRVKIIEDLKNIKFGLILLINIDSFQEVNDFYGYEVGDAILLELTKRLKEVKSDMFVTIYRLQSDEFAVVIHEDVEEGEDSEEIKKIVSNFVFSNINDRIFICNESEISIRATIGVAAVKKGENVRALYNADMALKKAKQLQKHYLVYEETLEIAKEYENNIKWTYILKDAITDDRIIPFYQPIINNKTGLIEKYECLCRLINKNNDIISPYYFLDIAKKTRLYPHITKRIISKAFEKFADNNFEFSINLSVVDILNDDTRRFIKSVIADNRETSRRAVFEILESEGLNNFSLIKSFIDDIKLSGCKIAIDDFGSGYSNFDHVISLDVDYIKIDASMIKNIDKERESQIITKTIVNFSRELNIKTVSEYVHSMAVFDKVKELGVDYSQGYLFGEPSPEITSCKFL